MAVPKSNQRAVNKYIREKYDRVGLTMLKGQKDIIKSYADANGESVNAFILRAINEAMNGSPVAAAAGADLDIDRKAIDAHIIQTGETVQDFVTRAIAGQIERDTLLIKMGMKVI